MTPQTKREFGPDAAARRAKTAERAARAERTKAVALDALDVGRGGPEVHDTLASAEELATRRASAAIAQGRPLRGRESRAIRQQFREERAGAKPAGQPGGKRKPTIYEWIEALTPDQRDAYQQSEKFERLSPESQAYFLRQLDLVEDAEEQAEYLAAVEREEQALRDEEDARPFNWSTLELEDVEPEADDDEPPIVWGPALTAEEEDAALDVLAANYGNDDLEEGYE